MPDSARSNNNGNWADLSVHRLDLVLDNVNVLDGIDHRFAAGTLTLVIGKNGSGKTMLLETMSGLRHPSSGCINVGGEPLHIDGKPNRKALLRIGTAFQHPEHQLFAQSVEREFHYSLKPYGLTASQRKESARAALRGAGVPADDWLPRDPFSLSGGEKRRLAMALLEAAGPDWLLLDEPTAGLDRRGIADLRERLAGRKQRGQGTIVVTHDPESLLELADCVLILRTGTIAWRGAPQELLEKPELFRAGGLEPPDKLHAIVCLRQAGFALPALPDARQTAECIAEQAATAKPVTKEASDDSALDAAAETARRRRCETEIRSPLDRFDPRALWLMYMLVTPGILRQSSWFGLAASGLVALAVIRLAGAPLRLWVRPALGLFVFSLAAALTAGLAFRWPPSFELAAFLDTGMRLGRFIIILIIGLSLLSAIPPLKLKRSLEQGLGPLERLRLPIRQFAMTAALIMRFIPQLVIEWQRLARIAASRGKYPAREGRVPIAHMRAVVVPFLTALLRLGDNLSVALIARGTGRAGIQPTIAERIAFRPSDGWLIAAGAAALALLLAAEMLFGT